MKNFENALKELNAAGITNRGIDVYRKGTQWEETSIIVDSINVEKIYEIAHTNNLIAVLNRYHYDPGLKFLLPVCAKFGLTWLAAAGGTVTDAGASFPGIFVFDLIQK